MLTPGTYPIRGGGRIAKVYEITNCSFHGIPVAIGAMFSPKGEFLGVETWRASDGQFHMIGDACCLDITMPAEEAAA
ncbi:MAG: hypothetical protein QM647_15265 [Asticcacaulis sp.]|uniref:hypothetical protein n=1 Tax=Asticcacaulis sp. TaxID=1872648 RepID=UPI0039E687E2